MATIPENTKTYLKTKGRFNRDPLSEKVINKNLLDIAKNAVGNNIRDDEPYTFRINFQNGRIVGSEAQPRLSVELLDGRSSTPIIGVPSDDGVVFLELEYLIADGYDTIRNEGSWVARVTVYGNKIKSAFVNHDFSEEDRELIEKALLLGFRDQIRM